MRIHSPTGPVDLHLTDTDNGRPTLLLHGGAGPRSVAGLGGLLAPDRVLVPTHPGFAGTDRPKWLSSIQALAGIYQDLLDELDLADVLVIGSSIGGWIAAELALRHSDRVTGLVLINATGIEVPGQPVADIFGLSLAELADLSYHEPDRYRIDESTFTAEQREELAGNRATLTTYAGDMTDPTLLDRLAGITVPTLVAWGASDQICTPTYGRAYAAAIPDAHFALIDRAGHLPQIEQPQALLDLIHSFTGTHADLLVAGPAQRPARR
ncbi:alpha/beta hydrolase [Longispora fulva]|uniref:Pimeloyl-ACP methyl ester carboxylesterase n=1 Tax=Longispora fulva TaxID=619741 RepID=A0A8J7GR02_9ACTN|nr:alpha/beta hydrolase [Longispora fulva]MBG6136543.1 pimeloyl-ACP methyl ester carboxylesterase [Longispora fulva]GIG59714.1 alpha/beta hydrolase [Longispora fulva]